MKKLIALTMLAVMLLGFTACNKEDSAAVIVGKSTEVTSDNADDEDTIESAEEAASYLMKELLHAAKNGNKERFAELCNNTLPEDQLQTFVAKYQSVAVNYDEPVLAPIDQNSNSHAFIAHFPELNNRASYMSSLFRIAQNDSGWYVSPYFDEVDLDSIKTMYESHIPEGYLDAKAQGRAYEDYAPYDGWFASDLDRYLSPYAAWLFVDETKYVDDTLIVEPRFAWETETGDIAVAFWCNNGIPNDCTPAYYDQLIFNDIYLPTINFSEPVKGCSNTLVTVTIPYESLIGHGIDEPSDDSFMNLQDELYDFESNIDELEEYAREQGAAYSPEISFYETPTA